MSDDHIKETFEEYLLALGKVAHAWNYLQEKLGLLFCEVTGLDAHVAFALWYSSTNDRAQRNMLRVALATVPKFSNSKANEDIVWLIDTADKYTERRNDAIHAPCAIAVGGQKLEIVPSFFNGHPRAKNLLGKNILQEFDWYEALAETLSRFANDIRVGMNASLHPWPNRPPLPTLGQKNLPQVRRSPTRGSKERPHRP